jgi:hypothetical protein
MAQTDSPVPQLNGLPRITDFEMNTTLRLRYAHGPGTCILWADDEGAYFATAAHLLRGVAVGDKVELAVKGGWETFAVTGVAFAEGNTDVAVFCIERFGSSHPRDMPNGGSLALGQTVYFLGYPLGLDGEYPNKNPFPSPLVKTATFAGVLTISGANVMVYDGWNNAGFSGGPIYAMYGESMRLVGIVSGYHYDRSSPVFRRDPDGNESPLADTYVKPNADLSILTHGKP